MSSFEETITEILAGDDEDLKEFLREAGVAQELLKMEAPE